MTKERLAEMNDWKDASYGDLQFRILDCIKEIDRLNRLIEKLVAVHHEYVTAMRERDLIA